MDLRPGPSSPCLNGGDPAGDYAGQTDLDGGPRVRYGRVDMGAYEVYPVDGDLELDEDVDLGDFGLFTLEWKNACNAGNAWCGRADADRSGTVDLADMAALLNHWMWGAQPE